MEIPGVKDVEHISAISDRVIRNLNITYCYYEISTAMAKLGGVNPNWCTYAVWASKQAGQSIRKEDMIRNYEYFLSNAPEIKFLIEELAAAVKNIPDIKTARGMIIKILNNGNVFERSAEAVANGNRKVFEEIGKEFARFLEFFKDGKFTSEKIHEFCKSFTPGEPPGGQQLLQDAFRAYYEAKHVEDIKAKAELFHYANLLIGFHEQTRLQPDIAAAMNAPFPDTDKLKKNILKNILPGIWFRIRYFIAGLFGIKLPLDKILDDLLDQAKLKMREIITANLMSLSIPGCGTLRLGKNLNINFPDILQQITNIKLAELLAKIDATPDDLSESGAEEWSNLPDRIHFIADFFRCYSAHAELFYSPFTAVQVEKLKEGIKPDGKL